jgi:hypothetical protein
MARTCARTENGSSASVTNRNSMPSFFARLIAVRIDCQDLPLRVSDL